MACIMDPLRMLAMDVSGAVSDARWNGPTLARVSARRILFDEPESLFQREGCLGCQVHNRVRIESEEHHPGNGAGQDNGWRFGRGGGLGQIAIEDATLAGTDFDGAPYPPVHPSCRCHLDLVGGNS